MKKTIKMICHGPISLGPKHKSLWEDVWIEYFSGKKRKVNRGPCIVGRDSLDSDLETSQKYGDESFHTLLKIKEDFQKGGRFGISDINSDVPEIYVNCEYVDRKVAEEAIAWYLRRVGVTAELKFKWRKPRSSFVLIPTSI